MWNKSRSLVLSIFCARLFMLLVVVVVCFASPIIRWYFSRTPNMEEYYPAFQIIVYVCAVPAMLLLILLDRLLRNIRRQAVFVPQNITLLRAISWSCIAVGLAACAAGFCYASFFLVAIAAAFCGLIVRVVKNVFEQAIEIKTENDYTI